MRIAKYTASGELRLMNLNVEDAAALIDYLRRTGRVGAEESPQVHVLTGGVSNRTVLVERGAAAGGDWVIKQALPKLRVKVDWFSDPARVHREALGLRWLEQLLPAGCVPRFVFEDYEHHLLAMAAVPIPHENWKTRLLSGRLDDAYVRQFAQMLAAIHRGSYERRDELAPAFADRSFFESLRLEPYYGYTATMVPEAVEFLHALIDETRRRRLTLVHGDYSPKNILIYQDRLVLLDHEVIHWGDPAFDVGFSMTHLLSKAHHLPESRGAFATAACAYWRTYADEIGSGPWQDDLPGHAIRHTLGCLLARVAGRSPLEYLDDTERGQQRQVVIDLMNSIPPTINELVQRFIERLNQRAED
jgi:aminoglycoside phosphotransferase (APT) family kinase protein